MLNCCTLLTCADDGGEDEGNHQAFQDPSAWGKNVQALCVDNEDDISFAVVFALVVPEINFPDVAEVHLFPGSEVPI